MIRGSIQGLFCRWKRYLRNEVEDQKQLFGIHQPNPADCRTLPSKNLLRTSQETKSNLQLHCRWLCGFLYSSPKVAGQAVIVFPSRSRLVRSIYSKSFWFKPLGLHRPVHKGHYILSNYQWTQHLHYNPTLVLQSLICEGHRNQTHNSGHLIADKRITGCVDNQHWLFTSNPQGGSESNSSISRQMCRFKHVSYYFALGPFLTFPFLDSEGSDFTLALAPFSSLDTFPAAFNLRSIWDTVEQVFPNKCFKDSRG